jgi:hypothetical protein
MKHVTLIAAAWLMSASAWAEEPAQADGDVRAVVREALDTKAAPPAQPPRLPDAASDRAREVHATTAFGKKGEAQRAAHEIAGKRAAEHANKARRDTEDISDRGPTGTARSGNAENRSAAARERSNQAKGRDVQDPKPKQPTELPGRH